MGRHKGNSINVGQNEIRLGFCWQSSSNASNNVQIVNACIVVVDLPATVKNVGMKLTPGNSKCEHFIRRQNAIYNYSVYKILSATCSPMELARMKK